MFGNSSNFGGGGVAQSPPRAPLKGLFKDGNWLCNCKPRLPALHLQTKKQNANLGRWFYTCQNKTCNFFLWEDEAKPREQAALVSNNSRSEPHPNTTPRRVSRGISALGSVDTAVGFGSTQVTPSKPPRSPNILLGDDFYGDWSDAEADAGSNEESYDWILTDDETAEFSRRTENVSLPSLSSSLYPTLPKQTYETSTASMPPPQTPHKAARTGMVTSPRKRSHSPSPPPRTSTNPTETGLQTPTTATTSRYFNPSDQPDPFKTPQTPTPRKNLFTNYTTPATNAPLIAPLTTPSPLRFHDPTKPSGGASTTTTTSTSSDLKDEVLALLTKHDITLPEAAHDELVTLLNKHTLRMQGIARGRDISRVALKGKEAKIRELQEKLGEIEARREVDRAEVRLLREGNRRR